MTTVLHIYAWTGVIVSGLSLISPVFLLAVDQSWQPKMTRSRYLRTTIGMTITYGLLFGLVYGWWHG